MVNVFARGAYCVGGPRAATIRIVKFPAIDSNLEPIGGRRSRALVRARRCGEGARGMKAGKQTTLRSRTAVSGIGVHSGLPVTLTLHPADAGTGVVFIRCVN